MVFQIRNKLLMMHLIAGIVAAGFFASFAAAQPHVRFVDQRVDKSGSGMSWNDPYANLQDALLEAAMGIGDVTEIRVAQGTYYPDSGRSVQDDDVNASFILLDRVRIYGGFPSGGDLFENRDPAAHPTILSGDIDENGILDAHNSRHVVISPAGVSRETLLEGFIISDGYAWGSTQPHDNTGAGLLVRSSSPSLRNCVFRDHSAERGGAAITVINDDKRVPARPVLLDCTITDNTCGKRTDATCDTAAINAANIILYRCEVHSNSETSNIDARQQVEKLNMCADDVIAIVDGTIKCFSADDVDNTIR